MEHSNNESSLENYSSKPSLHLKIAPPPNSYVSNDIRSCEPTNSHKTPEAFHKWQKAKEAKLRDKKLQQKREAIKDLKETPKIDPVSRKMAELLMEGEELPKTHFNSPPRPETPPELDELHKLIKYPKLRKEKSSKVRQNLPPSDAKRQASELGLRNDPHFSYMVNLKKRMDITQQKKITDLHSSQSKSTYDRTVRWKEINNKKLEDEVREKNKQEMKECTFRPNLRHQSSAVKKKDQVRTGYSPISPAYSHIRGFDLSGFKEKSKPLINYKILSDYFDEN